MKFLQSRSVQGVCYSYYEIYCIFEKTLPPKRPNHHEKDHPGLAGWRYVLLANMAALAVLIAASPVLAQDEDPAPEPAAAETASAEETVLEEDKAPAQETAPAEEAAQADEALPADAAAPNAPGAGESEVVQAQAPGDMDGNAVAESAPDQPEAGAGAIQRMEELTGELAPEAEPEPAYEPVRDEVVQYLDAIDRTEAMTNAYSTELADLYLGLGQSLLEQREYEQAKEAFQQGMQIVRVNYGLNSPEQSNYLYAIANIESQLGNRKGVDEVMENIYLINARNYGEQSPEMIPVLDRMLGWYMNHRPLEHEDSRFADMERAELLAGRKAEIVEAHLGLEHPQTAAVYRQMGQISWMTARYVLSQGMSVEKGLIVAVGSPPQNPNARAISIKSLVSNGEAAFAKVAQSVNQDENRTALEKAEAISQLGDWNLAFGRRRTAGEYYEQAHQLLSEDPTFRHYADEYFDQPTPVRFLQQDLLPVEPDATVSADTLEVTMTVTEGGRPLDVDIPEPPADFPADHVRLMKRMVSEMRFRPRLVNGTPEKIENFTFHLPLDDPEWLP